MVSVIEKNQKLNGLQLPLNSFFLWCDTLTRLGGGNPAAVLAAVIYGVSTGIG